MRKENGWNGTKTQLDDMQARSSLLAHEMTAGGEHPPRMSTAVEPSTNECKVWVCMHVLLVSFPDDRWDAATAVRSTSFAS